MAVLVDTNILLRTLQPHHPHCPIAERALSVLRTGNEPMYVTVQNLVEFWAVATRPTAANGLGLTPEKAAREMAALKRLFPILPESVPLLSEWERLVVTHRVSGKATHDARLVAAMKVHGVGRILTFDAAGFTRFCRQVIYPPP